MPQAHALLSAWEKWIPSLDWKGDTGKGDGLSKACLRYSSLYLPQIWEEISSGGEHSSWVLLKVQLMWWGDRSHGVSKDTALSVTVEVVAQGSVLSWHHCRAWHYSRDGFPGLYVAYRAEAVNLNDLAPPQLLPCPVVPLLTAGYRASRVLRLHALSKPLQTGTPIFLQKGADCSFSGNGKAAILWAGLERKKIFNNWILIAPLLELCSAALPLLCLFRMKEACTGLRNTSCFLINEILIACLYFGVA